MLKIFIISSFILMFSCSCITKISSVYQSKLHFNHKWRCFGYDAIYFDKNNNRYSYYKGVENLYSRSNGYFNLINKNIILNSDTNIFSLPLSVETFPVNYCDSFAIEANISYENKPMNFELFKNYKFTLVLNDSVEFTLKYPVDTFYVQKSKAQYFHIKVEELKREDLYQFNRFFCSESIFIKQNQNNCIFKIYYNHLKVYRYYKSLKNDTIYIKNNSKLYFPSSDSTFYYKPNFLRRFLFLISN